MIGDGWFQSRWANAFANASRTTEIGTDRNAPRWARSRQQRDRKDSLEADQQFVEGHEERRVVRVEGLDGRREHGVDTEARARIDE